jgi:hypothetical protein
MEGKWNKLVPFPWLDGRSLIGYFGYSRLLNDLQPCSDGQVLSDH